MARDFDGVTDRIDYGNQGINWIAQAQTISLWFNRDVASGASEFFFMDADSTDTGNSVVLWLNTTPTISLFLKTTSTNMSRISSSVPSDGVWTNIIVTHDGSLTAANAHIYFDGTETSYDVTTNGTGTRVASDGSTSLGAKIFADTNHFNGKLAECGRWTRELGAGERASLALGYSPKMIPNGLAFYAPLLGTSANDIMGQAATLDGTTVFAHPRVIYPTPIQLGIPTAAAGGGRIMSSLANYGGLAGLGGIAGQRGGLAG